jgi:hypothetical protein
MSSSAPRRSAFQQSVTACHCGCPAEIRRPLAYQTKAVGSGALPGSADRCASLPLRDKRVSYGDRFRGSDDAMRSKGLTSRMSSTPRPTCNRSARHAMNVLAKNAFRNSPAASRPHGVHRNLRRRKSISCAARHITKHGIGAYEVSNGSTTFGRRRERNSTSAHVAESL